LLADSQAAAVIVSEKLEGVDIVQLVVENVDAALITALHLFAPKLTPMEGIHPTAVIEDSAVLGSGVAVGCHAYIGHNVRIGEGTIISTGCVVGESTTIGSHCRLDGNVVVYHNCRIGDSCVIQANTTIGSTGFGYSFIDGEHRLIPHNGGVVIGDCVEIGANSCVDRAKFGNTIIGAGSKIDNLVQIAHNVVIGKCCVVAGQVGLSGSCVLGDGVVIGGQAGMADHLSIGAGAMVGGRGGVMGDIPAGAKVMGLPAIDMREQLRIFALQRRLPDMARQLREVAAAVEKLEGRMADG
jgi:UDP-3-O-[3-hydroxymyristoyl] glucosamine N-acyltransferase